PPTDSQALPPIDTRVFIISAASGRLFETEKEKKNGNGTSIVLRSTDRIVAPHRQWIIRRAPGSEYFTIVHVESNRLVDAERSSSNRDGTKVQLFGTQVQGNKERLWQFKSAGGNAFYIISAANGRYMDAGELPAPKTAPKVRLWGKDGEGL